MKTTITNTKYLFTLLLTTLFLVACSDVNEILDQPEQQPATEGIHFTAVFGVKNATTRALSDPGNGTLTASWQTGEQIAIIFGGEKYTATVISVDDNGSATVSATLPSATPNNQAVTFVYPASAADGSGVRSGLLASQDGSLATLSSQLDVATADGTIVIDGNTAQPNGSVSLENQYAVCKLQFKDESNQAITDITEVNITDLSTQEEITVTTPTPQSAVYVAMLPTNNSVKFEVKCSNGNIYKKIATSNLKAGLFYHPMLSTSFIYNSKSTPLTLEAIDDCTITFWNDAKGSLHYTIEGDENGEFHSWKEEGAENESITLAAGQKVSFFGDNATYGDFDSDGYPYGSYFNISGDCYVYGNIMSMISSTNFTDLKELTGGGNFINLFSDCYHLKNHPDKQLLLPATTLTSSCYYGMFQGCSGLSKAPDLPATTLEGGCYGQMFLNCTGLTKAPALPATTLEAGCYDYMFAGCSGLTKAPDLPATTLKWYCYDFMFAGCSGLTKAPDLPTTTLVEGCYDGMFYCCTGLTTAPDLPATTLADYCYKYMFYGCTGLTTAPNLPATTLAKECYKQMFQGCTGLTTAPNLPATTLTTSCYESMFEGCSSLTTAPVLPATTLAKFCYEKMFLNCTSLTKAPDLPATTLVNGCYTYMFGRCTHLNSVKCLATDISAGYCTNNWLDGVASNGTFTKAASMTGWSEGINGIPSGWTVVEE